MDAAEAAQETEEIAHIKKLNMDALIKALEAGNYNAAPSQLTQGSGYIVQDPNDLILKK